MSTLPSTLPSLRSISTHPRLLVAGAEEHGRAKAALRRWSPGLELPGGSKKFGKALRMYHYMAIKTATEVDADFFDALCNFNFGLITTTVDKMFAADLLARVHVWVSHPVLADTQHCTNNTTISRTGPELRRVNILFERKWSMKRSIRNCFTISQS